MQDRFKFRGIHPVLNELQEIKFIDFIHNTVDFGDGDIFNIEDVKIQQCTGLRDKNGKLIYEGNVVKINENHCDYSVIEDFYRNQNFVVEYFQTRAVYLLKPFEYDDNGGHGIYDLSPDFYEFLKWKPCGKLEEYTLQGIEVIGNVYENPELLEVENDIRS